ncbi:MAG: hypothetical protein ONB23_09995 [candidate division KSB1 bacterium]|nr:hypothetical protein [candidate division KSB1 bacterium]
MRKGSLIVSAAVVAGLTVSVGPSARSQHPNHAGKFPKLCIQQAWVDPNQICIVDIVSKFDLIQAGLSAEQVQAVRAANPRAVIQPFWSTHFNMPDYRSTGSTKMDVDEFVRDVSQLRSSGFDGVYIDLWNLLRESFADSLADILRRTWPNGIHVVNAANSFEYSFALNGFLLEDYPVYSGDYGYYVEGPLATWRQRGYKPTVIVLNVRSYGVDAQYFWEKARFATTLGLLHDELYVMYNYGSGGSPHWAVPWWFDEWSAPIGTPVGPAQRLDSGVYFREFTNGVVLCNLSGETKRVSRSDLPTSGELYRIRGGQVPSWNNGALFDEVELKGWRLNNVDNKYAKRLGDGIILLRQPVTIVSDIIIDDEGTDDVDPNPTFMGRFQQSGMQFDPMGYRKWQNAWYVYGHSSCYYAPPSNGTSWARWIPQINISGSYEVFEWHPSSPELAKDARYTIKWGKKETHLTVNQTTNGGKWNSLGVFWFQAGEENYVEVRSVPSGTVVADAVKFVYRGTGDLRDSEPPSPPRGVRILP